jgi:hypothetical protein
MAKRQVKSTYNSLIAAILNFFVWGFGYFYAGEYDKGIAWFAAMVPFVLSYYFMGLDWVFFTLPGELHILARIVISMILAVEVYHRGDWNKTIW